MGKYKITVEEVVERDDDKYASNNTIYEQIVTGDESIVNGVVQTVLDYNQRQDDGASHPRQEQIMAYKERVEGYNQAIKDIKSNGSNHSQDKNPYPYQEQGW